MKKNPILQVSLPIPVHALFDYEWAENAKPPPIGARVSVLAKNRACTGIVIGHTDISHIKKLKAVSNLIDTTPIISDEILFLCKWASKYYQQPIGNVITSILPKLLRKGQTVKRSTETIYKISEQGKTIQIDALKGTKQRQLIELLKQSDSLTKTQILNLKISNSTLAKLIELKLILTEEKEVIYIEKLSSLEKPLALNTEQQKALNTICQKLKDFGSYLLYGVTGSGKTEIYMHAIQKILDNNQQVLMLVPEIGLTPQTLLRFQKRFQVNISIMHSGLSEKQKLDTWLDTKSGKTKLLIGTRSALFTPMPNLGLIIVDEEHDSSYKQTERFRYHARDLSIIRAKNLNIPIILGSATPSLESMHNALSNRYRLLTLSKRANLSIMPNYKIIDMRNSYAEVSDEMLSNIKVHLNNNSQVLLFLNRRGFAPIMLCPNCGWSAKCNDCDTNFTYHKNYNVLLCHSCAHKQQLPPYCLNCKLASLKPIGIGTEKLADILQEKFPETDIIRIDQDTTRKKGSFENYLDRVNSNKPMILIGTQILAKGHHFINVNMVGILGVDNGLYSSDFHAIERLGQTITQVSGRAGRANTPGVVFIQTHNPEHKMLQSLINTNYLTFLEKLLQERKSTGLPPYSSHALFISESDTPTKAITILKNISRVIKDHLLNNVQILGPFPAIHEKRQGRYRSNLLLQSSERKTLQLVLAKSMPSIEDIRSDYKTRWIIDVNPIDLM